MRTRVHSGATLVLLAACWAAAGTAHAQPQPPPAPAPAPVPAPPPAPAPPITPAAPPVPAPEAAPPTDAPKQDVKDAEAKADAKAAEWGAELNGDPPLTPQPPIGADEERPMPDYDGREDAPLTAGEVLIWIPRGLFFPVYLVTEYVLRRPIGALVTAIDEAKIPAILGDVFTFGPDNKMGLVPSALIDFGFRPSIGAYFFSDDLPVDGLGFRSHVAFGGIDWWRATGTVRYTIDKATPEDNEKFVQIKGVYQLRPDWLFYGLGPESIKEEESGYGAQTIDAYARYLGGYWRSGVIHGWAGITHVDFLEPHTDAGPPPDKTPGVRYAQALDFYPIPPLFEEGYFATKIGAEFSLDTRPKRFVITEEASDYVSPNGSGVKLAPRGELGIGLREASSVSDPAVQNRPMWIKYGGSVGAYLDIYQQRVIGIQGIFDFIDPFDSDAQIPFTELVSLGGKRPMRGFLQNRLLGQSSAVWQLEYTWPIWVSLDGSLHYAVGNVFGEHLEDFDASLLRQSFGVGFAANSQRDHNFELLFALGTETFDQGSSVDTFRFVIGASEGY